MHCMEMYVHLMLWSMACRLRERTLLWKWPRYHAGCCLFPLKIQSNFDIWYDEICMCEGVWLRTKITDLFYLVLGQCTSIYFLLPSKVVHFSCYVKCCWMIRAGLPDQINQVDNTDNCSVTVAWSLPYCCL
jgi:hypothetical protein